MFPDVAAGAPHGRASSAILRQPSPDAIHPLHRAAPLTAHGICPRVSTLHSPPSKRRTVGDGRWRHYRRPAMGPTHPEALTSLPSAPARRSCTCWPASRPRTSPVEESTIPTTTLATNSICICATLAATRVTRAWRRNTTIQPGPPPPSFDHVPGASVVP